MSVQEPLAASEHAPEGPSEGSRQSTMNSPIEGLKQAHADMVAWCYKSHGAVADEQLKKLDEASVKREHVAYGLIALSSLYLLAGQQAFFLSALIAFTYPAFASVKAVRAKDSAEALYLLLYWVPFGFASLLDSTFVSDLPAYFLLKTWFLTFLFLPQTQGTKLIYFKAIEPVAKLVDGFVNRNI
uniref:Receptor expression-enhancing protein n=1 Tax=Angiostrongylus cantonensis TaxID=6313 RepID=A0A0K0D3N0_ANGCA